MRELMMEMPLSISGLLEQHLNYRIHPVFWVQS